jgi:hypothetical protein
MGVSTSDDGKGREPVRRVHLNMSDGAAENLRNQVENRY